MTAAPTDTGDPIASSTGPTVTDPWGPSPVAADAMTMVALARQSYLDGSLIPTAIVDIEEGEARVCHTNDCYERIRPSGAAHTSPLRLLDRSDLAARVRTFGAGTDVIAEFDWIDGDEVHGRHYRIRLGRLMQVQEGVPRVMVSALDRTTEVQGQRSLRNEMLHDSLTGLPNRAAFAEQVADVEAAGFDGATGSAVLIVDLARFSRVNECMGPTVGDELIITVARRILGVLRSGDTLARIGGDEFAILLSVRKGQGDAIDVAHRVQAALSTPFRLSELEIRVDCAIGCALPDPRRPHAGDLFRNAQFAAKRAKLTGRIELYQPGEVNAVRRRFSLETALRRAIDGDRLRLDYQPLIDLRTGSIAGFEALARWDDAPGGPIGPAEFIPVAEECGLILPLGRWALETAARTLAEWDVAAGLRLPIEIGVNVSAVQIQRDDVAGVVAAVQARYDVAGRLKLELTESCIVADPTRAMRVMGDLKAQHVRIAMDDFGTGYSSLAYLQRLPIDELKIDRSFVTPMLRDRDSLAIVRAVLSLAAALGMNTTAEGVETPELGQTLAALGCTLGQGWHYGHPLHADAAIAYWRARSG